MNITTRPEEELWHNVSSAGAYEWWYFDAVDVESGISFVVIWFCGFPFSPSYATHYEQWKRGAINHPPHPSDYSAFSFQCYEQGQELINFIKESDRSAFSSNPSSVGVTFEQCSFTYQPDNDSYQLSIAFDFPARNRSVKASFCFAVQQRVALEQQDGNNGGKVPRHQWLLGAPYARVSGDMRLMNSGGQHLRTITVQGAHGYHDHNLGELPMQEYMKRWYWGRAFSSRYYLVYYLIFYRNTAYAPRFFVLLHDVELGSTTHYQPATLREEQLHHGLFAPLHSRQLFLSGNGASLTIEHHHPLDAGPFYLRFPATISLKQEGQAVITLQGISEFLNPQRLNSHFFRFFTRSRILRSNQPSLMYNVYNRFKQIVG
uniref:Hydroxyneurosporene synthase n=1 Tax=Chlorobium chlorochromatii (strain CaD3) TaxID=340177 RepID=Q3ATK9_CHLCH